MIFTIITTYTHIHIFFTHQIIILSMDLYKSISIQYLQWYTHMYIFSNQQMKGYDAGINNKGIQMLTYPCSKIVPRFTSLWGSLDSTVKIKFSSIIQRYNPVPRVPSVNNYWLIILGCTPNVYMIPFGNDNDQPNLLLDLPFSTTQSLEKSPHPLPCSHSPSKFPSIPCPGWSIHWQRFLASEGPKTKAYPYLKTIILAIACSWKSMDTIGY